ncbi:hypothetical protein [Geodermatophilus sp. SYSU D01176]
MLGSRRPRRPGRRVEVVRLRRPGDRLDPDGDTSQFEVARRVG